MLETRPTTALEAADSAVAHAAQVRAFHRRRTEKTSRQRRTDIEVALRQIAEAMAPLRSMIGQFPYPKTPYSTDVQQEIKEKSAALQRERRKLWKMLPREAHRA